MAKIVVITAATWTIPKFRIDMIDEFRRRGNDVVVFGDEDHAKWDSYFATHEVTYRTYPIARNGVNPVSDLKTLSVLKKMLREEMPDKVFTYQAKPNIYGTIAAHSIGVKECFAMMGGLGSVFHSSDIKSRLIGGVVSAEYRLAFKHVVKAFFQNKDDVNEFVSRKIISNDKVVMVRGSGVNVNSFDVKPFPTALTFLFIGRLVRGKGVIEYLEAAREVKNKYSEARFMLVGPFDTNPTALSQEDLRPFLEDKTVEYLGELDDVHSVLADSSVFVLPSYYGEGTPKSALEAMATGRPVIMADAVGSREVVKNGINGFLVPPKDSHKVAAAMMRFLEERELVEWMGARSRQIAEDVFDVRKVNSVICDAMGV